MQKRGFQFELNALEIFLAASAFIKNAGANDAIPIATAATIANIFVIRIFFYNYQVNDLTIKEL
jgi:hypothetical protein